MIARGKMDTKKGWQPRQLTSWGRANIGSVDDAKDLVDELDAEPSRERRGEIWRLLQKGTGSWTNRDPEAVLRPSSYRPIRPIQQGDKK